MGADVEMRKDDVDSAERQLIEDTLRFIAQLGWKESAENFLVALARYLGETLAMAYVVIDRIAADDPGAAETVALYAKGTLLPTLRYTLKGTPCENVMGKRYCCYPRNVQELFPTDTLLVEMGANSYAGVPLWDSDGEAIGLIAVMDVAPFRNEESLMNILQLVAINAAVALERERTDLQLRERDQTLAESESRFRRLAENAPDVIYRMSLPAGAYEYISPAATALFGYAPEEFYASPGLVQQIIHPDWRPYFMEMWEKLLREDMPSTYEFQIVHRSGEVRWMNQRNILVRDDDGRIVAIEGIVTDVTERKEAEEELRRLKDDLERRIHERTAELEEKNAELERLNKIFVGRELRMMELKERIRELEERVSRVPSDGGPP